MRHQINTDDNVGILVEDFVSAKYKSKIYHVLDENGFLIKIRVDVVK